MRTRRGYKDLTCGDLDAIEEEGTKLEELEKVDEDGRQILEECQAKINKKYGYGAYNKDFQYGTTYGTMKGPKMSNSTLDTLKGKRVSNHNRNGSWVVSQSEREDYSHNAQYRAEIKNQKRKPITTPTRFYREDPLFPSAYSDKYSQYVPRNILSHNGSFSERMNMSETGSYGRLRQSNGMGIDRRTHLKSSFQGTFPSGPIEDQTADQIATQNIEEREFPYVKSAERLGPNLKRRFQPIERSVDYKVDVEKVGLCLK